jgi:hypothetical protein
VPLKAGIGCGPTARNQTCLQDDNTLYFRWITLDPGESQVPEALYHKNASAWMVQSPISSVIRDGE